MKEIVKRFKFAFLSTKGLVLVGIALCALISAFFGMLSGPMADFGIKDVVVKFFGIRLIEAQREGRLIILYHTIAMIVVAVETYMITDLLPMKKNQQLTINSTITIGYWAVVLGGLPFAYWGHNWPLHGLYIAGSGSDFLFRVLFISGFMALAEGI